jgi:hypothetical protein
MGRTLHTGQVGTRGQRAAGDLRDDGRKARSRGLKIWMNPCIQLSSKHWRDGWLERDAEIKQATKMAREYA